MELIHKELTQKILRAYYNVYNKLGYGFLEKVYENAMLIELRKLGLKCSQQKPIKVYYEGKIVGEYFADIIVEDSVICELKAVSEIHELHEVQLMNYLKATEIEVGLILNFSYKPMHMRKILTKKYK